MCVDRSGDKAALWVASLKSVEKLQLRGVQTLLSGPAMQCWCSVIKSHQKQHSVHLHTIRFQSEGWKSFVAAVSTRCEQLWAVAHAQLCL